MAATKKENNFTVRKFKNSDNDWWCEMKHFTILNGELILAAGGIETEELRNHMIKYLKGKKLL